jgi:predicted GIY-YIG superfamily endonuclease
MNMDKGNIYKIVSDSTDKIYIGSTVKTLEKRLEYHENSYEIWYHKDFRRGYCTSFEILKYGD